MESKTYRTTGIAIMAALVILLQIFATAINAVTPWTVPVALVLPPIIIGTAIFGVKAGMILGLCFGVVVLGSGIFGFAPTSAMMWGVSPLIMTVGTLGRGLAIGLTAGIMYKIFSRRSTYLGALSAAIIVPFVNTGIFAVVFYLFLEVLMPYGEGLGLLHYASVFIIGINFLMELIFNILLGPTIVRIIEIVRKRRA
ncbi:MAG: hypothetical protein FWF81_04630 [Defluviitaleaceae bacterium]|nr:hypothetical protein [Defluviitaleaceae bacterium]